MTLLHAAAAPSTTVNPDGLDAFRRSRVVPIQNSRRVSGDDAEHRRRPRLLPPGIRRPSASTERRDRITLNDDFERAPNGISLLCLRSRAVGSG